MEQYKHLIHEAEREEDLSRMAASYGDTGAANGHAKRAIKYRQAAMERWQLLLTSSDNPVIKFIKELRDLSRKHGVILSSYEEINARKVTSNTEHGEYDFNILTDGNCEIIEWKESLDESSK
jgi:hypothetical protein